MEAGTHGDHCEPTAQEGLLVVVHNFLLIEEVPVVLVNNLALDAQLVLGLQLRVQVAASDAPSVRSEPVPFCSMD